MEHTEPPNTANKAHGMEGTETTVREQVQRDHTKTRNCCYSQHRLQKLLH